ncbi:MAG: 1-propanol dehydrogenase PduQ [Ruminococcus sp.]|jgi:1-propanol dehydrogenase
MKHFTTETKIITGTPDWPRLLKDIHGVLVVTDRFLYENRMTEYVTRHLESLGIPYEIFCDVKPDPDLKVVAAGMEMMHRQNPDGLIAFGGGSAIDAAKAIRFFDSREKGKKACFFLAVPTTSGTGSEVSRFSVISDTKKDAKYPLVDDSLVPDAALLDASLTVSVPPKVTIDTGIDVLTHAIEAFVSKEADDFTDGVAEKALRLVKAYFMEVVKHPENKEARQKMHNASCLAGIAFSNGGLGINHSMAHTLGGHFHLPHGRVNGILLPYVIGYNAGYWEKLTPAAKRYEKLAALFSVEDRGNTHQSIFNLLRIIRQYRAELSIPTSFQEAGIEREAYMNAIPEMAAAALEDRCTPSNPRTCTKEDLGRLFLRAYEGNLAR